MAYLRDLLRSGTGRARPPLFECNCRAAPEGDLCVTVRNGCELASTPGYDAERHAASARRSIIARYLVGAV